MLSTAQLGGFRPDLSIFQEAVTWMAIMLSLDPIWTFNTLIEAVISFGVKCK